MNNIDSQKIDKTLIDMLKEVKMLDSSSTLIKTRKLLSHTSKKLDPEDVKKRKWAEQTENDYKDYKAKVKALEDIKKV